MGGEVTAVGGNGRFARAADEGEGERAAGGHDRGGRTAAQGGALRAKGPVTQPVAARTARVPPNEREQAVRVRVAGGEAGVVRR